jgi:hypothetical protein
MLKIWKGCWVTMQQPTKKAQSHHQQKLGLTTKACRSRPGASGPVPASRPRQQPTQLQLSPTEAQGWQSPLQAMQQQPPQTKLWLSPTHSSLAQLDHDNTGRARQLTHHGLSRTVYSRSMFMRLRYYINHATQGYHLVVINVDVVTMTSCWIRSAIIN